MSALQRPRYPVPPDVERALAERGLMGAYLSRPDYQRNDYVGWIARAKREDTRCKRLEQMLDELQTGDAYMGMAYRARRRGGEFEPAARSRPDGSGS